MKATAALVLVLALPWRPGASAGHGHASHAVPAVPASAGHVRWQPDPPLQEGMRRMRRVVDALDAAGAAPPDVARTRELADQVRAAANDMFARCTLDPEPDAALHGILARLLAAAGELTRDPAATAPVESMRGALADYVRLFDDPGFLVPAR